MLETLAQFGLLFFGFVFVGFIVFHRSLTMLCIKDERIYRLVVFALSVLFYLVLTEIHYSVWSSKY